MSFQLHDDRLLTNNEELRRLHLLGPIILNWSVFISLRRLCRGFLVELWLTWQYTDRCGGPWNGQF